MNVSVPRCLLSFSQAVFLIHSHFLSQQILSCPISVSWGLELECLINKFNDFDKLMNTFFPFFYCAALKHFNKLKKLGTSSASVKRACFIEGAELAFYISANKLKIERKTGLQQDPFLGTGVKYIVDMYLKDSNLSVLPK